MMKLSETSKMQASGDVPVQEKATVPANRRRKTILLGVIAAVLCIAIALPIGLLLSLSRSDAEDDPPKSGAKISAENLAMGYTREDTADRAPDEAFRKAYMDFAVKVFQGADGIKTEDNLCFSPLSAMLALAMTANGADGETLSEMEALLCGDLAIDELNATLRTLVDELLMRQSSKNVFQVANSIWVKKGIFMPDPAFLQTNANYYGAEVYAAPFDDSTVDDMNLWIKQHTNGLIEKMVKELDPNTKMSLINTLYLEAEWGEAYENCQISEGTFHSNGGDTTATMLSSCEAVYLSMDGAHGFTKSMYGYSFVALLPDEGTDAGEFIASLTGEALQAFLGSSTRAVVHAKIPAFSYDTSMDLTQVLRPFIPTAMSLDADFSKMGETVYGTTLYIEKVQQDTSVTLDRNGISAAAATKVDMMDEAVSIEPIELPVYYITLDRPFVYAILDNTTGLPILMGIVEQI
ncbi:MAG: serpin family protein [Eubacteriales bacterium]